MRNKSFICGHFQFFLEYSSSFQAQINVALIDEHQLTI